MLQSKRERFLLLVVMGSILTFGGTYLYQNVGSSLLNMDDLIAEKEIEIENLLDIQDKAIEIQSRYEEMKQELQLAGNNAEQIATIRKSLSAILQEVGIRSEYSISQKEPQLEDEFKIASINITQIQCTPQQLGQLLYRIENQSKVMEVENCRITNLISEVGKVMMGRSRGEQIRLSPSGLLDVDMQISRLIEYRKGEKPKRRGRS